MAATVVVLIDDIFFLAKIQETAKALGVTVVTADLRRGVEAVSGSQAIFLDLGARTFPPLETIRTLKADPATSHVAIVGFASHVQTELIAAARTAGCDVVLARSAFTQQLPDLLRRLVDPPSGSYPT